MAGPFVPMVDEFGGAMTADGMPLSPNGAGLNRPEDIAAQAQMMQMLQELTGVPAGIRSLSEMKAGNYGQALQEAGPLLIPGAGAAVARGAGKLLAGARPALQAMGEGAGFAGGSAVMGEGVIPSLAPGQAMAGDISGDFMQMPDTKNSDSVMGLQNELLRRGYNIGSTSADGKWGGSTKAGYDKYVSEYSSPEAMASRAKAVEDGAVAQRAKDEADAARAAAETQRLKNEQSDKVSEGVKAAREQSGGLSALAIDYAPYLIGGGVGGLARRFARNRIAGESAGVAQAADDFAEGAFKKTSPITPNDVSERSANVNAFWERGGGGSPFHKITEEAAGVAPRSGSASQMPIDKLYPTGKDRLADVASTAGVAGVGAADYGIMNHLASTADQNAESAEGRFSSSQLQSDAEAAAGERAKAEMYRLLGNVGGGMTLGTVGAHMKGGSAKLSRPSQKSMAGADAERDRVNSYLTGQNPTPTAEASREIAARRQAAAGSGQKALAAPSRAQGGLVGTDGQPMGMHHQGLHKAKAEQRENFQIVASQHAEPMDKLIAGKQADPAAFVKKGDRGGSMKPTAFRDLRTQIESETGYKVSGDMLRKYLRDVHGIKVYSRN